MCYASQYNDIIVLLVLDKIPVFFPSICAPLYWEILSLNTV